jgi:hypothetical protein
VVLETALRQMKEAPGTPAGDKAQSFNSLEKKKGKKKIGWWER